MGQPIILDVEAYREYGPGTLSLGQLQGLDSTKLCWCAVCSKGELRSDWEERVKNFKPDDVWDAKYDECFALLPSRVNGFALESMCWGQFLIRGVREINYDNKNGVWEALKLTDDQRTKSILKALVMHHNRSVSRIQDAVPKKGAGLVILLHGKKDILPSYIYVNYLTHILRFCWCWEDNDRRSTGKNERKATDEDWCPRIGLYECSTD